MSCLPINFLILRSLVASPPKLVTGNQELGDDDGGTGWNSGGEKGCKNWIKGGVYKIIC